MFFFLFKSIWTTKKFGFQHKKHKEININIFIQGAFFPLSVKINNYFSLLNFQAHSSKIIQGWHFSNIFRQIWQFILLHLTFDDVSQCDVTETLCPKAVKLIKRRRTKFILL